MEFLTALQSTEGGDCAETDLANTKSDIERIRMGWRRIGSKIAGGDAKEMFKKRTPLEWVLFFIVIAMVVVLFWLASFLEKASF
jgi:hypothetical protein